MAFEFLPEEKQAFLDINFVERYEKFALARQFPEEKKNFEANYKPTKVKELIESMGYTVTYNGREKFFRFSIAKDEATGLEAFLTIDVRSGRVELIWSVTRHGESYAGNVLNIVSRVLISLDYRIPYPQVRSYEELREVLEENISLYLEFFEALKKYQ
ncbi:hypothetical protein [Streptococcus suis]|uniref:hypothetical protein n=2 Tax=Streptococcus suis TaxID=1307 RepID=UPI00040CDF1B|nr:hypothetical protein [Streptococcus suis]MBL6503479.1 hypothetical protein [Streptococcus suis]MBM7191695.1 hypothetical protein [Streptococcus suis]MCO8179969.1 hypothetical protein [Streptococcus suis]MCO8223947.1 hypothetical protein [Streptococcus suis]NJW42024.1 hypothetical protein [Streptococcus suis]